MDFSNKLQQLRKRKNLSQEQLAETLGVSRQAISKWETGESMPEIDKVIEISHIFSISIDSLLKKDLDPFTPSFAEKVPAFEGAPTKVLALGSLFFSAIGLIVAFALWAHFENTIVIAIGFILQLFGFTALIFTGLVGKAMNQSAPPLKAVMVVLALVLFIPLAVIISLFSGGSIAPYPIGLQNAILFVLLYTALLLLAYYLLKKKLAN